MFFSHFVVTFSCLWCHILTQTFWISTYCYLLIWLYFGVVTKKLLPAMTLWRFTAETSVSILYTKISYKLLLEFCTLCEIRIHIHSLAFGLPVIPELFVERWFFPFGIVLTLSLIIKLPVPGISVLFHWSLCTCKCQSHIILIIIDFILKSENASALAFLIILKDTPAILGFFP